MIDLDGVKSRNKSEEYLEFTPMIDLAKQGRRRSTADRNIVLLGKRFPTRRESQAMAANLTR